MFVKRNAKAHGRNRFALTMLSGYLMFFTGCEKESLTVDHQSEMQEQSTNSTLNYKALYATRHTMRWEEAVALAEDAAELHFGNATGETALRRSGNRRIVNGGRVLERSATSLRSASDAMLPDTMAYICNFADSAGFAVICADDRVGCPILACVESGTLDDSADNPGLAIFLENAQVYMEESILRFEEEKDSLLEVAERELEAHDSKQLTSLRSTYTGSFKLLKGTEEVKPLLNTTWAQSGSPYNDLMKTCKSNVSGHAPAGCWAVAIGQLMAYYQYPKTLSYKIDRRTKRSLSPNWSVIVKEKDAGNLDEIDAKKQVGELLYGIGLNIDMDYGCDGSSAKESDAMSYLKACGYSGCGTQSFTFEKAKGYLDLRRPVLMNGKQKKVAFVAYDGHAWVVDGYTTLRYDCYTYTLDLSTNSSTNRYVNTIYEHPLLHINWGWKGKNNGYFAAGCFDVRKAESYDTQKGSETFNYQYDLEIHAAWR